MKLKEKLRDIMGSESADVVSSMDLIGDIAIIKIPDHLSGWKETIASEVLKANTNIKSVFVQKGPIHGTTRLRKIAHIKGSTDTTTLHREYGCRYLVDVQDTYFSPRLSEDRNRVSNIIKENEVVINMFAGVGPYSILIAKRNETSEVYSIELNSVAVNPYFLKNCRSYYFERVLVKIFECIFQFTTGKKLSCKRITCSWSIM